MLVTRFITPIFGPEARLPVISGLMLINDGSRGGVSLRAVNMRTVLRISAVALPMAWLGAQLHVRMDSTLVQMVPGGVLIAPVSGRRRLQMAQIKPGPVGGYAIGPVLGFLSWIIAGAGLLILPGGIWAFFASSATSAVRRKNPWTILV